MGLGMGVGDRITGGDENSIRRPGSRWMELGLGVGRVDEFRLDRLRDIFIWSMKTESNDIVNATILKSAPAKGAVCLDGTPPAYFYRKGFGDGANNWMVYLPVSDTYILFLFNTLNNNQFSTETNPITITPPKFFKSNPITVSPPKFNQINGTN
ncbi:hypothetical protein BUALT_Bualt17G0058000 [Buddleja alternifolia]|uniref:Pectin acetylesterase n=1 Tax=Buddleja alternifolia TaxID=168488 RepID=A0AAV6W729_9LAMI|nr:hypothetical protein BUALT_Bualt17G0058000 [Buddleja alternifolia]